MTESTDWAFPDNLQPVAQELAFDLDRVLDAMVLLRTEVPEDAFTAPILGTERLGNGIVIRDDGLILTIGYLVTEATSIWITSNRGQVIKGFPLAYDQASGFGLVQPLGRLSAPALARGSAAGCRVDDPVLVVAHGGRRHALKARVVSKREFAGYWEYVLDEAIFTAPAHPQWGGAALVGPDGRLAAVGSLFVEEQVGDESVKGNMLVPIDLLEPILDDLLTTGRAGGLPRPWLGMYTTELQGHLVVAGVADGGPADRAGLKMGDLIMEVAGAEASGLADLFRRIWRLGPAGTDVPLTVGREGKLTQVTLRSADRNDFLKKPHLH